MRNYKNIIPYILFQSVKFPKTTLFFILLITVLLGNEARKIQISGGFERIFNQETPKKRALSLAKVDFDSNARFLLHLELKSMTINSSVLKIISDVTQYAKSLDNILDVDSLTSAKAFELNKGALNVIGYTGLDDTQTANSFEKVLTSSLVLNNLASPDLQKTVLFFSYNADIPVNEQVNLVDKIEQFLDNHSLYQKLKAQDQIKYVFFAGPNLDRTVSGKLAKDLKIIPLVLAVVAIIYYFSLPNLIAIFLPLLSIFMALIWLLGSMSLMKIPISITSGFLPVILLAVGASYSIYFTTSFIDYFYNKKYQKVKALEATFYHGFEALLVAMATTAIGFMTVIFSKTQGLVDLGILLPLGVSYTGIVILTFIPAAFALLPLDNNRYKKKRELSFIQVIPNYLVKLGISYPRRVLTFTLISCIVALYFTKNFTTSIYIPGMFGKNSDFESHFLNINKDFGIGGELTIFLTSKQRRGFRKFQNIQKSSDYMKILKEKKEVFIATSFVSFLEDLHSKNHPQSLDLLGSQDETMNNLFLFTFLDENPLRPYLNSNYQKSKIIVRTKVLNTGVFKDFVTKLEKETKDFWGDDFEVVFTGQDLIKDEINDGLIYEQMSSLFITVFVIFFIFWLIFKNIKMALISLIPNLVPIFYNFGMMGIFKIPLDFTTILTASGVFGIAVDDTVHLIQRFHENLREQNYFVIKNKIGDHSKVLIKTSLIQTASEMGAAVIKTSLTLCCAFSLLIFSEFASTVHFGVCMVITLFFCLIADLVIVPAVLILTKV